MKNEDQINDLQRQVNELQKLVRINGIINATLDIGKLLKLTMEVIKDIMRAEASSMLLYDEEQNDLVFKVVLGEAETKLVEQYRLQLGQGIAGWVAQHRQTVIIKDVYSDDRFDGTVDRETGFTTRSLLCAPLLFKGKLLGVIQAINPVDRASFDEHDLELFSVFADQASLAVQNAIFFQNALKEARIKTELQAVKTIHDTTLRPLAIERDNVSFAARSIHSSEISGVFHGCVEQDGRLSFFLGDVHDKGLPGGLKAARLDGVLRGAWSRGRGLKTIFSHIMPLAQDIVGGENSISLFAGEYNSVSQQCRFLFSGSMHVFLLKKSTVRYIRTGLLDDIKKVDDMKVVTVTMEPGDYFVVLSPRFLRVKDPRGSMIRQSQIARALKKGVTPSEKLDHVMEAIRIFSGGYWTRSDFSMAVIGV